MNVPTNEELAHGIRALLDAYPRERHIKAPSEEEVAFVRNVLKARGNDSDSKVLHDIRELLSQILVLLRRG